MRIGCFIWGVNGFGGAERVMVHLCNYFSQNEYDVTLFLTANDPESDAYKLRDDIKICCPGSNREYTKIEKYNLLRKEVKNFKPDVIISFEHMVNVVAILIGTICRVPVIISERTVPERFHKITRFLMKITYWHASYLIVQTSEIEQRMKAYCKRRGIIPNPVDSKGNEKKLYKTQNRIVAVGRLIYAKNYNFLIKVFKEFHREHREYVIDIYGEGILEDEIRKLISELRLENAVNLRRNHINILELLKDYDFYVMTSEYEGQPNSLLEAMAVGLPCICTEFDGGGSSVIQNNYNGICIKRGNEKHLLCAMKELAESEEKRMLYGRNAKKIIKKYGMEIVMKEWEAYVLKCLESDRGVD